MRTYRQLTQEERYQIWAYRALGKGATEIGRELGRDRSTISRELTRNSGLRGYLPKQAQRLAESRRHAKSNRRISEELWKEIETLLREDWSPEQIAGRFKRERAVLISHEWIYQYVYADKKRGGDLHTHLRCRKKHRKRYGSYDRRGQIKGRTSIERRPRVVEKRKRLGDWEGDTMSSGSTTKGGLVTAVERKSRYVRLCIVARKGASEVRSALRSCLGNAKAKTLTVDNGTEFTDHKGIASDIGAKVYFAHAYRSWERGTNENTNGLVRQYFPKGTDLASLSEEAVEAVEAKLNHRPRKSLGWRTPHEVYFGVTSLLTVALTS